jgi:hypothetical protein
MKTLIAICLLVLSNVALAEDDDVKMVCTSDGDCRVVVVVDL